MTLHSYAVLSIAVLALSTLVAACAARLHAPPKGKDKGWMISWPSWIIYGDLAAIFAWWMSLNMWVGFVIGIICGFAGPILMLIIAACTSKNGLR